MLKKIFLATVIGAGVIVGIYLMQKPSLNNISDNANNLKVFALLKQIASAQSIWSQENGNYSVSLAKLEKQGIISQQLQELVKAQSQNKEFGQHIYTDIINEKDTDDTRAYYGMQATPINAKSGKSFLLLMDQNLQAFDEKDAKYKSKEIQYYESLEILPILKNWPTESDLLKWKKIQMNIPEETIKEVKP